MTKYVEAGKIYNYPINFVVDGQPVSPTSAVITLLDNTGTIVDSINETNLTIPSDATSISYPIPAAANTTSLPYDLRYIAIKFVAGGQTYYINDFYSVKTSLRLPVTMDMVRAWLNFTSEELSDDQIDLFLAYGQVQDDITASGLNLDTLISTGSLLIPYIQQAVSLKAALNSVGSIELNIYQSEQSDNTNYKRFANTDFSGVSDGLLGRYRIAIMAITGESTDDITGPTLFLVQTPATDPVTGA